LFKRERAYIVICLLAPRKEIQDGLGFWLPHHRFKIPGTSRSGFFVTRENEWNSGTWIPDHKAKLSRPGFWFSQAKIFQNFGARTLSKVACAGENLTRGKNRAPLVILSEAPPKRATSMRSCHSVFHGPVYF